MNKVVYALQSCMQIAIVDQGQQGWPRELILSGPQSHFKFHTILTPNISQNLHHGILKLVGMTPMIISEVCMAIYKTASKGILIIWLLNMSMSLNSHCNFH